MRNYIIVALIIAAFFAGRDWYRGQVTPEQFTETLPEPVISGQPFRFRDHRITALQSFAIEGRVLSVKHYSSDRAAQLSNVDIALGWGPMERDEILRDIKISQSRRWYHWRAEHMPLPKREIETHSANMHMVPSTASIARTLLDVEKDQHIELQGYLILAEGDDGWRWKSSLTRNDTGNGACEVILLTDFRITSASP